LTWLSQFCVARSTWTRKEKPKRSIASTQLHGDPSSQTLMTGADKILVRKNLLPLDAADAKMEIEGGLIPHGGAGGGFASAVRLSQTCVT
jgi:hypothetical protein